jgi:hypothetical protein
MWELTKTGSIALKKINYKNYSSTEILVGNVQTWYINNITVSTRFQHIFRRLKHISNFFSIFNGPIVFMTCLDRQIRFWKRCKLKRVIFEANASYVILSWSFIYLEKNFIYYWFLYDRIKYYVMTLSSSSVCRQSGVRAIAY